MKKVVFWQGEEKKEFFPNSIWFSGGVIVLVFEDIDHKELPNYAKFSVDHEEVEYIALREGTIEVSFPVKFISSITNE